MSSLSMLRLKDAPLPVDRARILDVIHASTAAADASSAQTGPCPRRRNRLVEQICDLQTPHVSLLPYSGRIFLMPGLLSCSGPAADGSRQQAACGCHLPLGALPAPISTRYCSDEAGWRAHPQTPPDVDRRQSRATWGVPLMTAAHAALFDSSGARCHLV